MFDERDSRLKTEEKLNEERRLCCVGGDGCCHLRRREHRRPIFATFASTRERERDRERYAKGGGGERKEKGGTQVEWREIKKMICGGEG